MQMNKKPAAGIPMALAAKAEAEEEYLQQQLQSEVVRRITGENAVVVFSISGCCMCTVAKRLLFGLGVGPSVVELDLFSSAVTASDIHAVLYRLSNGRQPVPAIFVGGKFLGGIETLMACHISGSLVPLLKEAGALWL